MEVAVAVEGSAGDSVVVDCAEDATFGDVLRRVALDGDAALPCDAAHCLVSYAGSVRAGGDLLRTAGVEAGETVTVAPDPAHLARMKVEALADGRGVEWVLSVLYEESRWGLISADAAERAAALEAVQAIVASERFPVHRMLCSAVDEQHAAAVRALLGAGIDADVPDPRCQHGYTPLIVAVLCRYPRMVALLIDEGRADVERADRHGRTPLMHATELGSTELVRLLLERRADPCHVANGGETALLIAAGSRANGIAEMLLDAGAAADGAGTGASGAAESPLTCAAALGNAALALLLLERGADADRRGPGGATALLFTCACFPCGGLAEALLDGGCDADACDDQGRTPLYCAAEYGRASLAALLLQHGADPDAATLKGETPLLAAVQGNHTRVAEVLLEAGAAPSPPPPGPSPLHWAAGCGGVTFVQLLLNGGADASERRDGVTPLLCAVEGGHHDIVRRLVERGADVGAADPKTGETALVWAAGRGHEELVGCLLRAGADVGHVDQSGKRALDHARGSGWTDVAQLLIEHGADGDADAVESVDSDRERSLAGSADLPVPTLAREADPEGESGAEEDEATETETETETESESSEEAVPMAVATAGGTLPPAEGPMQREASVPAAPPGSQSQRFQSCAAGKRRRIDCDN